MVRKARNYQELGDVSYGSIDPQKRVRKVVKNVGKKVTKKVINAAKRRAKDMRMADPGNRCAGHKCTNKQQRNSILCKTCAPKSDQIAFAYADCFEEEDE